MEKSSAAAALPKAVTEFLLALSRVPYENLSKAVKFRETGDAGAAFQDPAEVMAGHRALGTGGTCFSLTRLVCAGLSAEGFEAYPVLCDRPYGADTHCCAILVWAGKKFLLDPGFLSFTPLPLNAGRPEEASTVFNRLALSPVEKDRYALHTDYLGQTKYRFTVKDSPVNDRDFSRAWRDSYRRKTLAFPVVTMVKDDAHLYLQKEALYVRRKEGSHRIAVPRGEFSATVRKYFGIDESVSKKALDVFY